MPAGLSVALVWLERKVRCRAAPIRGTTRMSGCRLYFCRQRRPVDGGDDLRLGGQGDLLNIKAMEAGRLAKIMIHVGNDLLQQRGRAAAYVG